MVSSLCLLPKDPDMQYTVDISIPVPYNNYKFPLRDRPFLCYYCENIVIHTILIHKFRCLLNPCQMSVSPLLP